MQLIRRSFSIKVLGSVLLAAAILHSSAVASPIALASVLLFNSPPSKVIDSTASLTAYHPTEAQVAEGFQLADALPKKAAGAAYMLQLQPHWFGQYRMWFHKEGREGSQFVSVDLSSGKMSPLFDEAKLISGLEGAGLPHFPSGHIPIQELKVADEGSLIQLRVQEKDYQFDSATGKVELLSTPPDYQSQPFGRGRRSRPAQTGTAGTQNQSDQGVQSRLEKGDVQVKLSGGEWQTVTHSGDFAYLVNGEDGQHILAWKCIPGDRKPLYLLHATGPDKTRATLETRLYDQPGDKLDTYLPYVIDAKTHTAQAVATGPMMGGAYPWPGAPSARWWNGGFLLDYPVRGYQEYKVDFIDPQTATLRNIVDETTKTFVDLGKISLTTIPGSTDLLWNSERDGWARLYRIDGQTGAVLNAVTPPGGVFRKIEWIDGDKHQIFFTGNDYPDCVAEGQNPYLLHLYRANFDGTNAVDLTPENGTHSITFSPDHQTFVDSYSRVDSAPIHNLVQSSSGKVLAELAKADIGKLLAAGVKLPIPFHAKGRDGVTEIWGVVCLPTHFNPRLKYPVIENIYAGPQDSFVPTQFTPVLRMSELAELGFVVVQIDGMGTDNRSRAFHDVCWQNITDAGFPDRILWMQALAKSMPQVDLSRVGVYGTSAGGQDAVNALLMHPEFYKVGVASCGCYDNRIDKQWWNEQWMGYPVGPWYKEQACATNAARLQGHLMLMDAEDDHNVPPESSIRLADAFIKAGKDFGYMIFPGSDHTDGGPFGERVRRNFFVQWLFGVNPPNWNAVDQPKAQ